MNNQLPGAAKMRNLAAFVTRKLPKGWGFAIVVFPFHRPGISNYVSNAQRQDMITALRETADRLEQRQDFRTPEEN